MITDHKQVVKEVAKRLRLPEETVAKVLQYEGEWLRAQITKAEYPAVFMPGLGTFFLSATKLRKTLEAVKKREPKSPRDLEKIEAYSERLEMAIEYQNKRKRKKNYG